MMHTDPPDHTRYRALVQPAFGRRVVKTLDESVRDAAGSWSTTWPSTSRSTSCRRWPCPLPVQVIAQLLGLPEDKWDKVWDWSEASIPGTEISDDVGAARGAARRDDERS